MLDALEQALYERRPGGGTDPSQRPGQPVCVDPLYRAPGVSRDRTLGRQCVGDSYDNALAETIIGLFKAEVIHRLGPWKTADAVE